MALTDWTVTPPAHGGHEFVIDNDIKHTGVGSGRLGIKTTWDEGVSISRAASGTQIKLIFWARNDIPIGMACFKVGHSTYGWLTVRGYGSPEGGSGVTDWTKYRAIFYHYAEHKWATLEKWNGVDWEDMGSNPYDMGAGVPVAGDVRFWVNTAADYLNRVWLDEIEVYKKP